MVTLSACVMGGGDTSLNFLAERGTKTEAPIKKAIQYPIPSDVVSSISSTPSGKTFLSTPEGLFVSNDGGASFAKVSGIPSGTSIKNLSEGNGGSTLTAATDDGIYISTDSGTTWTLKSTGDGLPSNNVENVFVDSSGNVFIATDGGVAISTDAGATFTSATTAQGLGSNNVEKIETDSAGNIYVATDNGISVSTDGGTSFTNFNTGSGLPSNNVTDFVVKREGGVTTMFVATDNGVAISTDGGATWEVKNATQGLADLNVTSIEVDSDGDIIVGTPTGVFIAPSNGETFTKYPVPGSTSNDIVDIGIASDGSVEILTKNELVKISDPDAPEVVTSITTAPSGKVYKTTPKGVFVSSDGGSTYTQVSGLPTGITIDNISEGNSGNTLVASTDDGIFISTDGGTTWTKKDSGSGLPSDTIEDVFVDSAGKVFVGTDSGIAISTDGGASFITATTAQGLGSNNVKEIVTDPSGNIYVATDNGLAISTDGGSSFTNLTTGNGLPSNDINDFTVETVGGVTTIYVATDNGIAISTDGGTTWSTKSSAEGLSLPAQTIAIDDDGEILVGTSGGLFAAPNDGSSFQTQTVTGATSSDIKKINIAPDGSVDIITANETVNIPDIDTPEVVYSMTTSPSGKVYKTTAQGVFVSTDDGATFTSVTGLPSGAPISNISEGNGGTTLVAQSKDGVFVSTDSGSTWTKKDSGDGIGSNNIQDVFVDTSGKIYVATDSGVAVSADGGVTFTNATTAQGLGSNNVKEVVTDPSGNIYVSTDNGLAISTDGGTSYTNLTTGNGLPSNNINDFTIETVGGVTTIYVATDNGIAISTDGGTTWATKSTAEGLSLPTQTIAVDNDGEILVGTSGGLFVSPDDGSNFTTQTVSGATSTDIKDINISSDGSINVMTANETVNIPGIDTPEVIHSMTTSASGKVYKSTAQGVFVSTDNGATFTSITGLPSGAPITNISEGNGGTTLVAQSSDGVYISTDSGSTWIKKNSGDGLASDNIQDVFVDSAGNIYIATDSGVSISTNGGTSFTNATTAQGLGSNNVKKVVTDSAGTIFVSTDNGLSYSTDGGTNFTNLTTGNGLPANDINDFVVKRQSGVTSIFVATDSGVGISTDDGTTWSIKNATHGLTDIAAKTIAIDSEGDLFVGTNSGLFVSANDGLSYTSVTVAGTTSNVIKDIEVAPDGTIKVVTDNEAVSMADIDAPSGPSADPLHTNTNSITTNASPIPAGGTYKVYSDSELTALVGEDTGGNVTITGLVSGTQTYYGVFVDADGVVSDPVPFIVDFDVTNPSVLTINRKPGLSNPTSDNSVTYEVTFDKPVTNVNASDFSTFGISMSAGSILGVSAVSSTVYHVSVGSYSGDGGLNLTLNDSDTTITDLAGNVLSPTTKTGDENFSIDRVAPGVVSISRTSGAPNPTNDLTITFDIIFDEDVTNVTTSDFSLTTGGTASGSIAVVTSLTASSYRVSVGSVTGSGTVRLDLNDGDSSIVDTLGNNIVVNTHTSGELYLVDRVLPVATSIVRKSGETNPTNENTITYTITFDTPVLNVAVSDFTLTNSGTTNGSIFNVNTVSATEYEVNVNSVTGDGTIRLDLNDSDNSINDSIGNTLSSNTLVGSETFTVDNTAPQVTSITRKAAQPNPTNGSSVIYNVTFDDNVTGVSLDDFLLTKTGSADGTITGLVSNSASDYDVTVTSVIGDGTLRLDVNDGDSDIKDPVNNSLQSTTVNGDEFFTIDNTLPQITSIVRHTSEVNPTNDQTLTYTVTFDSPVSNVGTNDFSITVTGTASAIIASVSPSSTTVYDVVVTANDGSGTVRLDLNDSDTDIVDDSTNILQANTFTSGESFILDRVEPVALSIIRESAVPALTTSATVKFVASFDESVNNLNVTDYTLTTSGSVSGSIASVVLVNSLTYDVTVNSITGDGTLRLDMLDSDNDVEDDQGNKLSSNSLVGSESYTIDNIVPTVLSITVASGTPAFTNTTSTKFTVVFSEDVSGVTTDDFNLTTTGTTTGSVASISVTSASTYDVVVNALAGEGTVRLDLNDVDNDIQDMALNNIVANTKNGDEVVTTDLTGPSVTSIVRLGGLANPTNDNTITYVVTFDEPVLNFDLTDLALTTTLSATASIASVTQSTTAAVYEVELQTVVGDGDIRLDLNDADTDITDLSTNTILSNTYTSGESFTIDNTAATPSGISLNNPAQSPYNDDTPELTVSGINESVTVTVHSDITCSGGNQVGSAASSGPTQNITLSALSEGSFTFYAKVTDSVGNVSNCSVVSVDYEYDGTKPALVSIVNKSGELSPTNNNTVTYTVTFDGDVWPVVPGDFSLNTTGSAVGTILNVAPVTASSVYEVTVNDVAGDGNIRLDLNDSNTTITDLATNTLLSGSQIGSGTFTIDNTIVQPSSIVMQNPTENFGLLSTPTVTVGGVEVSATVYLYSDSSCVSPIESTITATTTSVDMGTLELSDLQSKTYYAKQIDFVGNESSCSSANVKYRYVDPFPRTSISTSSIATNDNYGTSVSSYGEMMVVGAPGDSSNTGAIYIYEYNADTKSWVETKVTASDGALGDEFGRSVAINDLYIIVGAPKAATSTGAAYFYSYNVNTNSWDEKKFTASDGVSGDEFGASVGIDGYNFLVGSPKHNSSQGAAYLYRLDTDSAYTWREDKIVASDGASSEEFGFSVDMSNNMFLIGAPGNIDKGSNSGSAYFYQWDPSSLDWHETLYVASDGGANDRMGESVSLSNGISLIGAHGHSNGAAYMYERDPSDDSWFESKFEATDGSSGDDFGKTVAVAGKNVVIASPGKASNRGGIYFYGFDYTTGIWTEIKKDVGSASNGDKIGSGLSLWNERILVGAPFDDGDGADAGKVYRYTLKPFLGEQSLLASDGVAGDGLGDEFSLKIDNNLLVKSSAMFNSNRGAVYINNFDYDSRTWKETKITASDAAANNYFGSSVAIGGNRVVVGLHQITKFYILEYDPSSNTWQEEKFTQGTNSFYGRVSSISGNFITQGDQEWSTGRGRVYITQFDPSDSSWHVSTQSAPSPSTYKYFGDQPHATSAHQFHGFEWYSNSNKGRIIQFKWDPDNNNWNTKYIYCSSTETNAGGLKFGAYPSTEASSILTGGFFGNSSQGRAYLWTYRIDNDTYVEYDITPASRESSGKFGSIVKNVGSRLLIIGASHHDKWASDSGEIFTFRFNPTSHTWTETSIDLDSTIVANSNLGRGIEYGMGYVFIGEFPYDSSKGRYIVKPLNW